jgi:hypothetical protein
MSVQSNRLSAWIDHKNERGVAAALCRAAGLKAPDICKLSKGKIPIHLIHAIRIEIAAKEIRPDYPPLRAEDICSIPDQIPLISHIRASR